MKTEASYKGKAGTLRIQHSARYRQLAVTWTLSLKPQNIKIRTQMSPHHQSVGTDDLRKAIVIQILIDCCLDQVTQKAYCMQSSLSIHPDTAVYPESILNVHK